MASTPNLNIPLADGSTVVDPIQTPLNAMANAIDTQVTLALNEQEKNYFVGTNAQRLALNTAGGLRNGITWYATDTNVSWRRVSGAWVADVPFRMAAGVATIGVNFPTINFPAGRFTVPPIIVAQLISGAGADLASTRVMVTEVTATSFRARHTASTGTRDIHWHAVQMQSGSAAG